MLFAPMLFRMLFGPLLRLVRSKSENRSVAVDRKRRVPGAQLRGELASGRPRAAFEDARQRQRGRGEMPPAQRPHFVDQSPRQPPPLDDELVAYVPRPCVIRRVDEV